MEYVSSNRRSLVPSHQQIAVQWHSQKGAKHKVFQVPECLCKAVFHFTLIAVNSSEGDEEEELLFMAIHVPGKLSTLPPPSGKLHCSSYILAYYPDTKDNGYNWEGICLSMSSTYKTQFYRHNYPDTITHSLWWCGYCLRM